MPYTRLSVNLIVSQFIIVKTVIVGILTPHILISTFIQQRTYFYLPCINLAEHIHPEVLKSVLVDIFQRIGGNVRTVLKGRLTMDSKCCEAFKVYGIAI